MIGDEGLASRDREQRFRHLVENHGNDVLRYLQARWQSRDGTSPEDLLEDIVVTAWIHLDDIPVGDELPWLYGAARHRLMNARTRSNRRAGLEHKIRHEVAAPSAEASAIAEIALLEALSQLSTPDQEALTLTAWEGLSVPQLAVALGVSEGAAAVRLSRAKGKLLALLAKDVDVNR
jgi:RNA polymerase sigma factor (sigma-70 family)